MDPALLAQRSAPAEPGVTPQAAELLFIVGAWDRALFQEMESLVVDQHFQPHERVLLLLWRCIRQLINTYNGLNFEMLSHAYTEALRADPLPLSPAQLDVIFRPDTSGLLFTVGTARQVTAEMAAFTRDLLRRWLMERSVVMPLRQLMAGTGLPGQLDTMLDAVARQRSRLSTLDIVPIVSPGLGAPAENPTPLRPIGVSYLDAVLGGQRVGDANGLIGPTGGGKTTYALYQAACAAQLCDSVAQRGGPREIVVFITVEQPGAQLRGRIWSALGQIPRAKVESLQSAEEAAIMLTAPGALAPYEAQYGTCEQQRLQYAIELMSRHLVVLDLSGTGSYPTAGGGYLPEIVSYLDRIQQQYQCGFHSVYIDWAGMMVAQHVKNSKDPEREMRRRLADLGDDIRRQIAGRFSTTAWVIHQLKGAVQRASPVRLFVHTEAAECADFAVAMSVCLCMGTVCPRTGCRRMNISKHRYTAEERVHPLLLRPGSSVATMDEVSELFRIDTTGSQFLDASELGAVHTGARRRSTA